MGNAQKIKDRVVADDFTELKPDPIEEARQNHEKMQCIRQEIEALYDAVEQAVTACVSRINLETNAGEVMKYLRQSPGEYIKAVKSLDKKSLVELLEVDCERWAAELDLEIKKSQDLEQQAIQVIRGTKALQQTE